MADTEEIEMLPEYDFRSGNVERGKFYERVQRAKRSRVLDEELSDQFKDDHSVNDALREYLEWKKDRSGAGA